MKYFSLALALFVCAAVVSAAPSSPSPSFEELAFNPLDKINQKIQEFFKKFLCVRNVIEKAAEKSEFEEDYLEFKQIVEKVFDDLKKCDSLKCKIILIDELPGYFVEFFDKINKKNQELAEMIQEEAAKCFAYSNMFESEETYAPSLAEQFQCITDVLDQVSKNNGLEESWSRTQPIIQRHIDNLKRCPNAGKKFLVYLCNIREFVGIYKSYTEYLQLLAQQSPAALREFISGINQKCAGQAATEKFEFMSEEAMKSVNLAEKLKCINAALAKAVKDSNLESVYEQVQKDLEEVVENIKACKDKSGVEVAKCVYGQLKLARGKIADFLNQLKETNEEAYEHALEYIKECFA